jgi:phosphoglycolate phosphatase-like HAD superfamily hydrolase
MTAASIESGEPGRLRAVVFDFDGVVLESADVKTDAFVELFAHLPAEQVEAVRRHHLDNMGISRFKKFAWIYQNLLARELTEAESQELGVRFSDIALQRILVAPFVPGAREALTALAPRYPLFVASGTPDGELKDIVARRELDAYFREVWGTPTEKPQILTDLMTRHGLTADQVLFIGDGMSDYKAARATGVHFLARDTAALHDDWVRLGCRRVLDLTTLPEVVATW